MSEGLQSVVEMHLSHQLVSISGVQSSPELAV